jgi:hypothetical protein
MDIVEFAENVCGIELLECQKEFLRKMNELRSEGKIYLIHGRRGPYIYVDKQMQKELVPNGKTNDSK